MGSFSIWHWLIVLLIVVLVFGTKKLKNMGSDLGGAVKGFKEGMQHGSSSEAQRLHSKSPPTRRPTRAPSTSRPRRSHDAKCLSRD